jgi:uncharacterized surface protein with fasciclin (FAS1) repeats
MDTEDNTTQEKDIVINVQNAGNFSTLYNALKTADLATTYKGMGPFTFFAPTDAAFAKLPKGQLDALLKDKAKLAATLNLHVIRGALLAKDIKASDSQSVQGGMLTFVAKDGVYTVNGAKVSKQQIEACNGVIHGIDSVMVLKH